MQLKANNSWRHCMLLVALLLSAEFGTGQAAILLRAASVSRDTIHLSDLLPPKVSDGMRRAAEQVELGRTPQCHTIRLLEPSDIEKPISASPLLRGLTLTGPVSVRRACFLLHSEAVQQAISEFALQRGMALTVSPLSWSEVVYSSQENPALEVAQTLPDPAHSALQIRLRCVQRTVCPSFWVAVPARQLPRLLSVGAPAAELVQSPALVESGQRVMLIFEDPPMRIQLFVTCLQRGFLGTQVRAMDPSTHRVFRAEVTGAGTLMAHI